MTRPRIQDRIHLPRYAVEIIIGFILAALIVLSLWATVGSVPFIYQGF